MKFNESGWLIGTACRKLSSCLSRSHWDLFYHSVFPFLFVYKFIRLHIWKLQGRLCKVFCIRETCNFNILYQSDFPVFHVLAKHARASHFSSLATACFDFFSS